jgi:catechol 2,3-dioxygenase-like lactoylglutathione lyase family enzyme
LVQLGEYATRGLISYLGVDTASATATPSCLVHLRHLGLPVRDYQRSLRFYATYFEFDPATATSYPDGTVIVRNAERFDLALHPATEAVPSSTFLHFGFAMADAEAVLALRTRLERDGVPVIERDDEPALVSFKCLDPDGWRVKVYWEPS